MEMQMEELRKQWITSEKEYREGEVFVYRQKFTASQVKKAVFYGTALGVYEAELNGTKIGRQMFAPGFSYYPRRVLYQTHEVTELLREGEKTLTVCCNRAGDWTLTSAHGQLLLGGGIAAYTPERLTLGAGGFAILEE